MAEHDDKQQRNDSERPRTKVKNRLLARLPTQRGMERKQMLKWGGWLVALFGTMYLATNFFGISAPQTRERPTPEPEFRDTAPNLGYGQEESIARMQRQIAEAQELARGMEARMEARDAQFVGHLEALQESLREERAATHDTLERLQAQIEDVSESAQSQGSRIVRGTESSQSAPRTPEDYLRPPRNGDSPSVVPPPPIERRSDVRPNLPARQERDAPSSLYDGDSSARGTSTSRPGNAVVLDGQSETPNARVLRNDEAETDDTEQEGPPMAGFLPMGSFADVAMLTGADFGASDRTRNNPQPVLFRVQADAFLPGRARYGLMDCFGMGAGYGDLSSERAKVNVTRISCLDTSLGVVLETAINGYLVDADGQEGLRGVVTRRQGAILGKAMLAGFAEGAADIASIAARGSQQTITGSGVVTSIDPGRAGEVGAYGGASRAMEILAEQYIKEAESMFPVIEVPAGRRATFVVQIGQRLQWESYAIAERFSVADS